MLAKYFRESWHLCALLIMTNKTWIVTPHLQMKREEKVSKLANLGTCDDGINERCQILLWCGNFYFL